MKADDHCRKIIEKTVIFLTKIYNIPFRWEVCVEKGGKHMVREIMDYISSCDEAVGKALYAEYHRQQRNLELIASENIVSPAVMLAMGTVPTNKYAEGYPEKRYYGGCEEVDVLEDLAIERAKKLFGAEHACVQPHSGASANLAVYQAIFWSREIR